MTFPAFEAVPPGGYVVLVIVVALAVWVGGRLKPARMPGRVEATETTGCGIRGLNVNHGGHDLKHFGVTRIGYGDAVSIQFKLNSPPDRGARRAAGRGW